MGRIKENGADSAVEPKSWQEALHLPGVGRSVVNLHFHPVVPLHAFPMSSGDKELAIQRYQATVLMEHVEKLDLKRGKNNSYGQNKTDYFRYNPVELAFIQGRE